MHLFLKNNKFLIKRDLGQNFLQNNWYAKAIAYSLPIQLTDGIIEIGPGLGSLTTFLVQRTSLPVVAIEIDQQCIIELQKQFLGQQLTLIHHDFLQIDLQKIVQEHFAVACRIWIVANLPYHLVGDIIFKIINHVNLFDGLMVMVQKEVGERMLAKPNTKAYNHLTVIINFYFFIEKGLIIKPHHFYPKPAVDSMTVKLITKPYNIQFDHQNFQTFIKQAFQFKRKTLANNLKTTLSIILITAIFEELNWSLATTRSESLLLDDFLKLFNLIQKNQF